MIFRRVIESPEDAGTPEGPRPSPSYRQQQATRPTVDAAEVVDYKPSGTSQKGREHAINHPCSVDKELALLRRVRLHARQLASSTERFMVSLLRLKDAQRDWENIGDSHCYGIVDKVSTIQRTNLNHKSRSRRPYHPYWTCGS